MANDYTRTSNSRFPTYSQRANVQRSGQFYNQGNFQQQTHTATPSGYYPAFQTSRPQECSMTFGLSSYGFQGWNQGNANYGKQQENTADPTPWRQMTSEASSGLSSLAFASGLAQASNSFDQLRAQSNMHAQHPVSSVGNNRATQTQTSRQNHTPQMGLQSQVPSGAVSAPMQQHKQTPSQGSHRSSGIQLSNSTLSVDGRHDVSNKAGSNLGSSSNSMFVNPSQVYHTPPTYRPTSQQSVEHESRVSEDPETNPVEANIHEASDQDDAQIAPQETKKRRRQAVEEKDEPKKKRKARKTGSSTAPSAKRRTKNATANTSNTDSTKQAEGLESQMRAMFLKMREFNQANPELLAKLWQEERENHISKMSEADVQSQNAPANSEAQVAQSSAPSSSKKAIPKARSRKETPKETPAQAKSPSTTKKRKAAATTNTAQPANMDPISEAVVNNLGPNVNTQSPPGSASAERSTDKPNTVPQSVQTPVSIATKEDRAYKKTFADLVDLTADSSDDEPMFSIRPPEDVPEMTNGQSVEYSTPNPPINGQSNQPLQNYTGTLTGNNHGTYVPRSRPRPPPGVALAQPLDKHKAIRRSGYNPKTIARDVLIACGRHPDMRRLNEHLTLLKDGFPGQVDLSSDLATVRWDLIDPGGPPPGSASLQPTTVDADDADDESTSDPPLYDMPPRLTRQAQARPLQLADPGDQPSPQSRSPQVNKDRTSGTYKIKFAHMDPSAGSDRALGKRGRPRGRPRGNISARGVGQSSAVGGGYNALRAHQTQSSPQTGDSETPKKRGRPVGWRKWMMKGATDFAGRRPGTGNPAPEPYYHIYKCHWAGCVAELHNLDTLRKHLYKKHEQYPPTIECLWSDCGKTQPVSDPATGRVTTKWQRQKFDTPAAWGSHIEKQHLVPIAWKFGDGPTGGILDLEASDATEAYNSDAQGRSVTPQIDVPTEHAEKALQYEMDILAGGRIPKKTQEEKARDVQLAVESEKRAIGPGIDRGGAIFANEKRRMGFIDEDDEIVSDEDN